MPEIWRRFLIKDNISFRDLHNIIQAVMDWENYHLFEFTIGNETLSVDEDGYNPAEASFDKLFSQPEFIKMLEKQDLSKGSAMLNVNKINKILKDAEKNQPKKIYNINTRIGTLITTQGQKFTYRYDFGDNWEHTLILEKIFDKEGTEKYPYCLSGKRACPPEDCGGVYGYYELMKIKKNKKHPEYKEKIVEWLGEDFDFESFDVDDINAELRNITRKLR